LTVLCTVVRPELVVTYQAIPTTTRTIVARANKSAPRKSRDADVDSGSRTGNIPASSYCGFSSTNSVGPTPAMYPTPQRRCGCAISTVADASSSLTRAAPPLPKEPLMKLRRAASLGNCGDFSGVATAARARNSSSRSPYLTTGKFEPDSMQLTYDEIPAWRVTGLSRSKASTRHRGGQITHQPAREVNYLSPSTPSAST
jgi:hypothetical protein